MESEDQRPNGATDMTGSAREVLTKNWNRTFAISVERTLARAGFAIVPVEPTAKTEESGAEAYHLAISEHAAAYAERHAHRAINAPPYRPCPAHWIKPLWQAMLSAARQQEGQDDGC